MTCFIFAFLIYQLNLSSSGFFLDVVVSTVFFKGFILSTKLKRKCYQTKKKKKEVNVIVQNCCIQSQFFYFLLSYIHNLWAVMYTQKTQNFTV